MRPGLKFSLATSSRKAAAARRRWQDPTYRDDQHQRRVNDKKQRFAGAFCTDPLDEPTLEEFDTWEYGGALKFNTVEGQDDAR